MYLALNNQVSKASKSFEFKEIEMAKFEDIEAKLNNEIPTLPAESIIERNKLVTRILKGRDSEAQIQAE